MTYERVWRSVVQCLVMPSLLFMDRLVRLVGEFFSHPRSSQFSMGDARRRRVVDGIGIPVVLAMSFLIVEMSLLCSSFISKQ